MVRFPVVNEATPTPPRVFISYSHDSPEHKERVLGLCIRLRSQHVACEIDRYELSPPEGWPLWMQRSIHAADFVLVVCSETYRDCFERSAPEGSGQGAKWEGAIMTTDLYRRELKNVKYLPVLFEQADRAHVPELLEGSTFYDLSTDDGYEHLYRRLTNQPEVVRPDLGPPVPLPPRDVRWQDFNRIPAGTAAVIEFRDDLNPDEVSVYEAIRAIERGEPVAIRWSPFSDHLYELLVARRPDLRRQLLARGHDPGEELADAIHEFDVALAGASHYRDRAAERIAPMWRGMEASALWGLEPRNRFRRILQNFLVLANVHALLALGRIQFEDDHRPLPGKLRIGSLPSEWYQTPAVAEALGAQLPFWAADLEAADNAFYVYAPRAHAIRAYHDGAALAGGFFADFLVPQLELRLIGTDDAVAHDPAAVHIHKLRD